jgi:hypothetical protein
MCYKVKLADCKSYLNWRREIVKTDTIQNKWGIDVNQIGSVAKVARGIITKRIEHKKEQKGFR